MDRPESGRADFSNLFRLDGKIAMVVGGYGGIGRVVSRMCGHAGATVAIGGRSSDKADEAAQSLTDEGVRAIGVRIDASDPASAQAAVAEVVSRLGGLDVLINLASVDVEAKAEDVTQEDWDKIIGINLSGAFWLSQMAGRAMIFAGRGGRIIHFSSTRSVAGGRRGFAPYGASKAGLNMLIKQLATEWARHRITVNGVAPGFVPTELVRSSASDEKFVTMMLQRIPFGRFGEPIEMAAAALFLASSAASFVTGQILFVDGGVTSSS